MVSEITQKRRCEGQTNIIVWILIEYQETLNLTSLGTSLAAVSLQKTWGLQFFDQSQKVHVHPSWFLNSKTENRVVMDMVIQGMEF